MPRPAFSPADESPILPAVKTGRRHVSRLRLSIPARVVSIYDTRRCILIDISCGGAQVGLAEPLPVGDGVCLQIADMEPFGEVLRREIGPRGGINGISFDPELSDADVLAIRAYSETFQKEERLALLDEVRSWVMGR